MSGDSLEAAMARLYVDARFRAHFLADPLAATRGLHLAPEEACAFAAIDRDRLVLLCAALDRKRAHAHPTQGRWISWWPPRGRRLAQPTLAKETYMLRIPRCIARLLGTALVLAAFCKPALAQELEPNNSCLAPQAGGDIVPPARITGRIDPLDATAQTDVDFLRFTARPGLALRLTVSSDQRGGLFDEQCRLIAATVLFSENTIDFLVPASGRFIVGVADPFDNAFTGNGFTQGGPWELLFSLQPPSIGSISGRLVDPISRKPLGGGATPFARVELRRCNGGSCFDFVTSQPTDARGMFRFELDTRGRRIEAGDFQLDAFADEYRMVSVLLTVGPDESPDVGDLALVPPPILFSDIRPCAAILPQGGVCEYSARIRNNTTGKLAGLAHSVVEGGFGASRFEAGTRVSDTEARRAVVRIAAGGSQVVTFAFRVPSFVPNGTVLCADLELGFDPSPLFNPARRGSLFCMAKGDSGFRAMSPLQSHMELERRARREGEGPRPMP